MNKDVMRPALPIRFSGARLLRCPDHFLALGFRQFVQIRLDRLDGSTSHPMRHLGVLWGRILFFHMSSKPIYIFDIENYPPPNGVTWPFSRFRIVSFTPSV
jgi:hypothetical protein